MRSREEIEKELAPERLGMLVHHPTGLGERVIISLLLDIREQLQEPPVYISNEAKLLASDLPGKVQAILDAPPQPKERDLKCRKCHNVNGAHLRPIRGTNCECHQKPKDV